MNLKIDTGRPEQDARVHQLLDVVLAALEDMKAIDAQVLDVHDKTSITDLMVIASGNSERHVRPRHAPARARFLQTRAALVGR